MALNLDFYFLALGLNKSLLYLNPTIFKKALELTVFKAFKNLTSPRSPRFCFRA
jgi:hypothetical protein